ncbi:MAG: hypothetical protein DIJKHBIC_02959 [Thermoanaerobaculia bacterium]|nr:hypothetical protein [Thermoanaerobaculia bacterium]
MSIIACLECGHSVSTKALACPHCGCPTAGMAPCAPPPPPKDAVSSQPAIGSNSPEVFKSSEVTTPPDAHLIPPPQIPWLVAKAELRKWYRRYGLSYGGVLLLQLSFWILARVIDPDLAAVLAPILTPLKLLVLLPWFGAVYFSMRVQEEMHNSGCYSTGGWAVVFGAVIGNPLYGGVWGLLMGAAMPSSVLAAARRVEKRLSTGDLNRSMLNGALDPRPR